MRDAYIDRSATAAADRIWTKYACVHCALETVAYPSLPTTTVASI